MEILNLRGGGRTGREGVRRESLLCVCLQRMGASNAVRSGTLARA